MSDFVFRPDSEALGMLMRLFGDNKNVENLVRLSLSLGGVVAGGAAITALETRMAPGGRRYGIAKDVDLWFPNSQVLDAFLSAVSLERDMTTKKSFGGYALDIRSKFGGPTIQAITYKTGDAVEIMSQFDFTNCAVAINSDGFWYHKDVPELLGKKKLKLLNDNSAFFVSRVLKYVHKGFNILDEPIQERLCSTLLDAADKSMEAARAFVPEYTKALPDFDKEFMPVRKALGRAEGTMARVVSMSLRTEVLTDARQQKLQEKVREVSEMMKSLNVKRQKAYDLPYGYARADVPTAVATLDDLFS